MHLFLKSFSIINSMKYIKIKHRHLKIMLFCCVLFFFALILSASLSYKQSIKDKLSFSTSAVVSLSQKITHQPDSALKKQWKTTLANQDANVDIAVYNHKNKQTTIYNNSTDTTYYTASIVKVSILANLLRQHEEDNTALSSTEKALTQKMIKESDNDATTTLLNTYEGSYSAPDRLFSALNMSHSKMNVRAWGLSTTTADDQVKLLNTLAYGKNSTINSTNRNYILNLMANINPNQDWGIGSGVNADATIELKNGWLNYDNSWIINSVGHIETDDTNYTIAVLTNGNTNEQDGIDLIERMATVTAKHLASD